MRHASFPFLYLLGIVVFLCSSCSMAPRRVAIMDFENATGSTFNDKLKVAVPEYLTQYLSGYDSIHLLERQDIHRFLAEIDADPSDTQRLSRWQKLGQKINAQYLIAGSCSRLDRNFILTARIFSVETGQVIPGSASTKTCINESEIFDRAKNIASELAYQLKYRSRTTAQTNSTTSQYGSTTGQYGSTTGQYGAASSSPIVYERSAYPENR